MATVADVIKKADAEAIALNKKSIIKTFSKKHALIPESVLFNDPKTLFLLTT